MPRGIYIRTDEMKKNMSNSHKGYVFSEEHKRKIGLKSLGRIGGNTGNHHSEEHKNKMSKLMIGNNYALNYKHTNEAKEKIRITSTGRKHSPESIEKIKLIQQNRSEQTKKKMSDNAIKRIQNNKTKFKDTKPELDVEQILKDNDINYVKQFRLSNRLFDFYLTDYNLLIEVDGIFYHGKGIEDKDLKYEVQKRARKSDNIKNDLAIEKGFNLIRIWQDEIDEFKKYIKDIIKNNYLKVI
jgi:very-short-patch-repair endonuclease